MTSTPTRSLRDVVGARTYSVWVDMLRILVPEGRTHRLSVVIAGMLHYTLEIAGKIKNKNEHDHAVAMSLMNAAETADPDEIKGLIHDVIA